MPFELDTLAWTAVDSVVQLIANTLSAITPKKQLFKW